MINIELQRLLDFSSPSTEQFKFNKWRTNDFECNAWNLQFRKNKININYNIKLADGSLLPDNSNKQLLESIKFVINFQTHPAFSQVDYAASTAYARVANILFALDYILLNFNHVGMNKIVLSDITNNEYKWILYNLSLHNHSEESVYRWSERLSTYLKINSASSCMKSINKTLQEVEILNSPIPNSDNRFLQLNDHEILIARAWLWINGFYRRSSQLDGYTPNTLKLSGQIYNATFRGVSVKAIPPELILRRTSSNYGHEHERKNVRAAIRGERALISVLNGYHSALKHLSFLGAVGLPNPAEDIFNVNLEQISTADEGSTLQQVRETGRYISIPFPIALNTIKEACEFILKFGRDILSAVAKVKIYSKNKCLTCAKVVQTYGITHFASPTLLGIGISHWCFNSHVQREETHYEYTRGNQGVYELSVALYGAIQLVVGCTMARRQDELINLHPLQCKDRHLLLSIKKTGSGEVRESEHYPIHDFVAQALRLIIEFQDKLITAGVLDGYKPIFSRPSIRTTPLTQPTAAWFNRSIDAFCDYIEKPIDESGRRYYIRQHQLRRFFAQMFFWSYGSGMAETLVWFLGHTSSERFYRYIAENTPGEILQSVKSEWTSHELKSNNLNNYSLQALIFKHFNTDNFSVIDQAELIAYLDSLQNDGSISITPHFFSLNDQPKYSIIYEINEAITD